ncbi:hypothetical protein GYA25_01790 [Candidatus Woesearchaeota archaeon]|nr:hypothetical protein [Candidatus Woesearchaeota archaeon]
MKKAVLDTNFIIYCIDKKIDFFSYFHISGFRIIIPEEVINEIKKFSISAPGKLKKLANLSLKFLDKNDFDKIKLNSKIVDNGLINLVNNNEDFVLASLDKKLKDKVKGQKIVIRGNKKIELV